MTSYSLSSLSPLQEQPDFHTQTPNSIQNDEYQNQSQPQSPQTQTLEISDPQNPEKPELNRTHNQQREEEQEGGDQEQDPEDQSGMSSSSLSPPPPPSLIPPIADPQPDSTPLTSPTSRRNYKRKTGGGGGKKKKQQQKQEQKLKANEKKAQTLIENLKPIPFSPSKTLNFDKHEKLLRRLGLWDFVHIEFDRDVRVDLVAQLIANYENRGSWVNGVKVKVNRADLARAFLLPVKKETVDLDSEVVTEESISFIEDFVSNWVLLHEELLETPTEVLNWMEAVKDGHPEKVDWAGMIWLMMERELVQGKELKDCYYALHLQYLIKSQKEFLFEQENKVESEVEVEEDEDGGEVKMWEESKVEVEEEERGGEVKMGQESKVEDEVDVKEEEDGGEAEIGHESKVEGEVEMKEEEAGGELKMVKEPVVEEGVELEEKDGGEVMVGQKSQVEDEVEVEDKEDGGGVMHKEGGGEVMNMGSESKVEVKEEEDGGEVKTEMEPMVEEGVEVKEEADVGELNTGKESMVEVKEEEDVGEVKMGGFDDFQEPESEDNVMVEEPNIELTLGKEVEKEEEAIEDGEMMDVEETEADEQGQWLLDGKNSMGDHFLQRCNIEDDRCMDGDEERKPEEEYDDEEEDDEEEEEVEDDDGFNLMSRGNIAEGGLLTGNLLQGLETSQMPFGLTGQLHRHSDMEFLASRTETHTTSVGPSIFGNGSKRAIVHEDDISYESLNGNNKKLRTDGTWSHKSSDFEMCMEEMQHWMGKARMMYQAKEQACEESNMSQQFLLTELQRRDQVIEHLQKSKREELQKKDGVIFRLERDLYLMGNLLEGYRKAVKETQKAFSEYRQQCQLPEEPLYKDAGPGGGVVLSTMELEKQRLKQEEEDRLNRMIIEQKVKEFEEELFGKMEAHFDEVEKLNKRLVDSENEVKLLKELSAKTKVSGTSECAPVE